jgi:hypothetical protein
MEPIYLVTGQYHNGDAYADKVTGVAQLAYILSDIKRWSDDERIDPSARINARSINIELEEEIQL